MHRYAGREVLLADDHIGDASGVRDARVLWTRCKLRLLRVRSGWHDVLQVFVADRMTKLGSGALIEVSRGELRSKHFFDEESVARAFNMIVDCWNGRLELVDLLLELLRCHLD